MATSENFNYEQYELAKLHKKQTDITELFTKAKIWTQINLCLTEVISKIVVCATKPTFRFVVIALNVQAKEVRT